jgi:CRISPR-associated protein Csd2
MITQSTTRHDAMAFIEVIDGNPNGDPDNNNEPRSDISTGQGLISDVSLKRQIRNTRTLSGYDDIFIKQGAALNALMEECWGKSKFNLNTDRENITNILIEKYWDIRMFGQVLSTGKTPGYPVRGCLQISFGRSLDPIEIAEHTITRCASAKQEEEKENKTMGNKMTVPYGLYTFRIAFCPNNKASDEDLEFFWQALKSCWELNRSASRGFMATRQIVIFSHESRLGSAPTHDLFDTVSVAKQVEFPRKWEDYKITYKDIPEGISRTIL